MAIYEYKCSKCGEVVETFWLNDDMKCPQSECGAAMKRKFSTFGIVGFNDESKARDKQEAAHARETEKEEKDYKASEDNIKKGDEKWRKNFADVTNARSPARAEHLELRSTPGTKEHRKFSEEMGRNVV